MDRLSITPLPLLLLLEVHRVKRKLLKNIFHDAVKVINHFIYWIVEFCP